MSWRTVDIDIDAQEIVEKIPTSILEEELKNRKELQVSDIKAAEHAENNRTINIDYEIDPDDYDLVDRDDISLSDFSDDEIVWYLENSRGYHVFDDVYNGETALSPEMINSLQSMPRYKLKDFLCDLFNLSHLTSKDDIAAEITFKL